MVLGYEGWLTRTLLHVVMHRLFSLLLSHSSLSHVILEYYTFPLQFLNVIQVLWLLLVVRWVIADVVYVESTRYQRTLIVKLWVYPFRFLPLKGLVELLQVSWRYCNIYILSYWKYDDIRLVFRST